MKRYILAALILAPLTALAQQAQPDAEVATYQQLLSEANSRIAAITKQAVISAEKAKKADEEAKQAAQDAKTIADLEDQIKKLSGQE